MSFLLTNDNIRSMRLQDAIAKDQSSCTTASSVESVGKGYPRHTVQVSSMRVKYQLMRDLSLSIDSRVILCRLIINTIVRNDLKNENAPGTIRM